VVNLVNQGFQAFSTGPRRQKLSPGAGKAPTGTLDLAPDLIAFFKFWVVKI
jgi:hypothetical protein